MDPSTWKTAGTSAAFATLVLVGIGASDWGECLHERQSLLAVGPPATEGFATASQNWLAIEEIWNLTEEIPESAFDRAKLVAPTCDADAPLANGFNWYLIAGVVGLFAAFCFVSARPSKIKEAPKRKQRQRTITKTTKAVIEVEPLEISVEDISEAERQRDSETLMAFVEERRVEASETSLEEKSVPRMDGFYVPPGYDSHPILYADGSANTPANEDKTRFKSINDALKVAQRMVLSGAPGVQIRVAPGVYQTSIEIPPKVVVVNQRLPDQGSSNSRLKWMSAQELDDPDRVTILADADKDFGVKIGPGSRHGIFGCFIVGRKGSKQTGVLVENAETAAVVHCVIEGFSNSGLIAKRVGSELPGLGLVLSGSMLRDNGAQFGGGAYCKESSVSIESCVFMGNRSRNGGGLLIEHSRHPSLIKSTRFSQNRAQLPENPKEDPMKHRLVQWGKDQGLGGGLYITSSHAKLIDVEFVENGASIAGGAAAFLGSKVLIQNQEHRSRFQRNRSRIGGGIFSIGWPGNSGSLKIQDCDILENEAQATGGGVCVVGHNVVQAIDCKVEQNKSNGPSGIGGGVSCHIGGQFDAQSGSISENASSQHGGGLACINARMRLGGQVEIHNNRAGGSGGGVFVITEPCSVTEQLVAQQHFELPVLVVIDDATIRYNKCTQTGSGLRGGNLIQQPSLPIGFKVKQASVRSNTSSTDTDDLFVTWSGSVITTDVHDLKKRMLK